MEQFLQKDLLQGRIYYQHSGDQSLQDAFHIRLADNQQPPNLSPTYVSRATHLHPHCLCPLHLHLHWYIYLHLHLHLHHLTIQSF